MAEYKLSLMEAGGEAPACASLHSKDDSLIAELKKQLEDLTETEMQLRAAIEQAEEEAVAYIAQLEARAQSEVSSAKSSAENFTVLTEEAKNHETEAMKRVAEAEQREAEFKRGYETAQTQAAEVRRRKEEILALMAERKEAYNKERDKQRAETQVVYDELAETLDIAGEVQRENAKKEASKPSLVSAPAP